MITVGIFRNRLVGLEPYFLQEEEIWFWVPSQGFVLINWSDSIVLGI